MWGASGDGAERRLRDLPPRAAGFLDVDAADCPRSCPPWLSAEDIDVYTAQFEQSGFFGPVSFYRNLDANCERVHDIPVVGISMPAVFIGGDHDGVVRGTSHSIDAMPSRSPTTAAAWILAGLGHWTQQEDPAGFNAALLGFLRHPQRPQRRSWALMLSSRSIGRLGEQAAAGLRHLDHDVGVEVRCWAPGLSHFCTMTKRPGRVTEAHRSMLRHPVASG